jgi:exonuclease I
MGTLISCVAVRTCFKKRNGASIPSDKSVELNNIQKDIQRLMYEQQSIYAKQKSIYARNKSTYTTRQAQAQVTNGDLQKLDEQLIKFAALKQEPRLRPL